MSERFDLIVIGAGSAARDAANTAAHKHGARVALIEKERWGGSCPNVACQPTKAYLVAAELAHDVNALAPKLGVEAGRASVDLARLYAWKQSLKKPQEQWVEELRAKGYATYMGEASLLDARRVQVGEDVLEADRILIASGSRTAVPPIAGPRRSRLARPRLGARADRAAGVAARRRRGRGRTRVRPDVRAFRLAGDDRGRSRPDRARLRR